MEKETDGTKCMVCGGRAEVGVIGMGDDGHIRHHSFCKSHYQEYKREENGTTPTKPKPKPSKLEKEFKDAGLRVQSKNQGTQLVIAKKFTKVDYWPTTQRWYNRQTGESGIGKKGVYTNFELK